MNLISCPGCGVVLNLQEIEVLDIRDEEGTIIEERAIWHNSGFVPAILCPAILCPVCAHKIAISDKE